jgi:hypothetical protein
MLEGDGLTIMLYILRAEGAEDLIDLFHATAPPSLG